jgi:hypothetical protein
LYIQAEEIRRAVEENIRLRMGCGVKLLGRHYMPPIKITGNITTYFFQHNPFKGKDKLMVLYEGKMATGQFARPAGYEDIW